MLGLGIAVDTFGHHAQGVDVQAGVGLVEDRDLRLQQTQLQDLVALLLTAGKKASFTLRSANCGSISRSAIADLTSLTQCRSLGASPRTAVAAVRRKFDIDTPGTSTGYCMAKKRPARARSSTLIASTSSPSRVIDPEVTWYLGGWPAIEYDSVDLPDPLGGPMTAWVSPRLHGQVDALEDFLLGAVLVGDADVKVLDFQSAHGWVAFDSVMASSRSMASVRRSRTSGDRDLGDDFVEETAHDQAAGLILGDAAGAQVEQLLVVETAGGTGVSGADDLAGLDLQVRHRVGAGAVGQHQVAVDLEGVGAGGLGPDQHIAHPDGVRVGLLGVRIPPLQRTLVQHVGLAVRLGVVDQEPGLEELPGVGEVGAQQLGVPARGGR